MKSLIVPVTLAIWPILSGSSLADSSALPGNAGSGLRYQSAFTDYQSFDDRPSVEWAIANKRVAEIGGWRTYARQAYEDRQLQLQNNSQAGSQAGSQ